VQKLKEFCPGSLQPSAAKLRLFWLKNLAWGMPGQGFLLRGILTQALWRKKLAFLRF